jgi:TolB-like protein/predicted Zn-dependent protease
MAHKTNSFERFCKELKRRKVVHVITIYAATAFVILELVNMVARPLQLPDWTEAFVIVLLCIGFVIALFLSWVYDITPSGVKKTKPVSAVKHMDQTATATSSGWKIATYVSGVIIVALVAFNFIHRRNLNADISKLKKTIAVLPFVNDSPDTANLYFCNGMMDEILTQLQKIGDLRVKARTSVERYRNPNKDIKAIGRELGVSLIMEGSVRKVGNDLRITAQLINAKTGNHLWAETYDGKYTTKIFEFQGNVAKKVATSVNAIITPHEEKRIDSKPTTEILAHDLQLRGHEMIRKWRYTDDSLTLKLAFNLLNQSLKVDPEYIEALSTKCMLFSEIGNFDSASFYIDKIKAIDPENSAIYGQKGLIYFYSNRPDSALKYFFKEDKLASNFWINLTLGQIYCFYKNEIIKGFSYFQKAIDLGGNSEPEINQSIAGAYLSIDYYPKSEKYFKNAISLRPECRLIQQYAYVLFTQGKIDEAFHYLDSISNITPCEQQCDIMKFHIYTTQNDFEKAEKYYNKAIAAGYVRSDDDDIYIAYLYKETGKKKEALSILNNSIKRNENALVSNNFNNNLIWFSIIHLQLAAGYAMLDENIKALKYLSEVEAERSGLIEWPYRIRTFPGFDKLRSNPEFKAILKRIEDEKATIRSQVKEMEQRGEIDM